MSDFSLAIAYFVIIIVNLMISVYMEIHDVRYRSKNFEVIPLMIVFVISLIPVINLIACIVLLCRTYVYLDIQDKITKFLQKKE